MYYYFITILHLRMFKLFVLFIPPSICYNKTRQKQEKRKKNSLPYITLAKLCLFVLSMIVQISLYYSKSCLFIYSILIKFRTNIALNKYILIVYSYIII